jgi:hypothetical protein
MGHGAQPTARISTAFPVNGVARANSAGERLWGWNGRPLCSVCLRGMRARRTTKAVNSTAGSSECAHSAYLDKSLRRSLACRGRMCGGLHNMLGQDLARVGRN